MTDFLDDKEKRKEQAEVLRHVAAKPALGNEQEIAMAEVIQLASVQRIEEPTDAELQELENKAHAIRGAVSTIDVVGDDINPAVFWAVFPAGSMPVEWVRKAARVLRELLAEHDRQTAGVRK